MSIDWRVVPIQRWPGEPTKNRQAAPFFTTGPATEYGYRPRRGGVDWSATTTLLERELRELRAKNILLQMFVTQRDCRNDGWIRADARPSEPGVILTFDSKHGPLSYPCDTFRDWQSNVRAIALALEALRKVDRYGVTKRGEQYTGFGQLPPAGGTSRTLTPEAAALVVVCLSGYEIDADEDVPAVLLDYDSFQWHYREAAKNTHPDAGGSTEAFQNLQAAKDVLERHHRRTP
jgi:hypothetical protein